MGTLQGTLNPCQLILGYVCVSYLPNFKLNTQNVSPGCKVARGGHCLIGCGMNSNPQALVHRM